MSKRGNGEGSVTQLADGRWQARVSQNGTRKAYYGRTREEAAGRLVDAMADVRKGLPLPNERQTVGLFLDRWLTEIVGPTVRPKTLRFYTQMVRGHLIPGLGKHPLAKLTPQQVQAFLNRKSADGLSPRTVAHLRTVLRTALGQALKWSLVARNVAALADPPRVPERELTPLSPAEARQLLSAVREDRLEALFYVALGLGLRQGEALGLRWDDVDFEQQTLRIARNLQYVEGRFQFLEPKTKRSRRTIPLPPVVTEALRTHRVRQLEERLSAPRWDDPSLVFASSVGTPLEGVKVTRRLQRTLKQAGLPRQTFHDLRHAAASILAAQGVPARTAMEILGHSDIRTTMNLYTHIAQDLMRDAAERMNSALTVAR
jgi:integrase